MIEVIADLMTQHDVLRMLIDRCERLADAVDAGGDADRLAGEVVRLRVAFDHHNRVEEHQLRPILRENGAFGDVNIERMVSEHVDEHRAMRRRFSTGPTAELRETLDVLRAHLDDEERHFRSARVVEDVAVGTGR